jgi:hypothetical protein
MSYPPHHNRAHEYKYSDRKTQKSNHPAKSPSARPMRRFSRRSGSPRRALIAPQNPFCTSFVQVCTSLYKIKNFPYADL